MGGWPPVADSAPAPPFLPGPPPCVVPRAARGPDGVRTSGQGMAPSADRGSVGTGRGRLRCSPERAMARSSWSPSPACSPRRSPPRRRRSAAARSSPPSRAPRRAPLGGRTRRAWNQNVSKAPVDPRSGALRRTRITSLGGNQVVHPDFGGRRRLRDPLHHRRPPPATGPGQGHGLSGPERLRARADPRQRAGRGRLRPPRAGAPAPTGATCSRCTPPTTSAVTVTAGAPASTARFDLRSTRLRHDGWTSADAAGLSILAGLVRYGEVRRGPRPPRDPRHLRGDASRLHPPRHPLRLGPLRPGTCPRWGCAYGSRTPTSTTTSHRFPAGSQSRVIFKALYHYGIINADNGGTGSNWFITGARSTRWKDGDLNRLKSGARHRVRGRRFAGGSRRPAEIERLAGAEAHSAIRRLVEADLDRLAVGRVRDLEELLGLEVARVPAITEFGNTWIFVL